MRRLNFLCAQAPQSALGRNFANVLGRFQTVQATGYGKPVVALHSASFRLRSEEHTSELQSRSDLVCRLLLEKKKTSITLMSLAPATLATFNRFFRVFAVDAK